MNQPLFFHVRPKWVPIVLKYQDGSEEHIEAEEEFAPYTVCIKASETEPNTLLVGYAVTHKNDHYNKVIGRTLSKTRMEAAEIALSKKDIYTIKDCRIHNSVKLNDLIDRAKILLKIKEPVTFITRVDVHGKKKFSRYIEE